MPGIQDILKGVGLSEKSLSRVKLSRGFVGRATYAVVAALFALAVVASRTSGDLALWVGILVAAVFLIYFVGVLFFAWRNPGAALLEGSELITWKQIELASKEGGVLPSGPVTRDPARMIGRSDREDLP